MLIEEWIIFIFAFVDLDVDHMLWDLLGRFFRNQLSAVSASDLYTTVLYYYFYRFLIFFIAAFVFMG